MADSPNVLLILVDQLRLPCFAYGDDHGLLPGIKDVLGFVTGLTPDSPYAQYFPGFMALRRNAVALRNHVISAAACTPSRATMMTGQYGTRTGVTQTDGLFKSGDAGNFPWLLPNGIPTVGDWFRAAGYTTHYFGKWHVSNPVDHSLEEWGFSDWELSWPEPHGSLFNNLGTYRDRGFTDLATSFLRRRGLGWWWDRAQGQQTWDDPQGSAPSSTPKPFFAVVSLTNPHDIATYPALPRQINMAGQGPLAPVVVPSADTLAPVPTGGTMQFPLNPANFPQESANLPPSASLHDSLANKPDCQFDSSYKIGLALASTVGNLQVSKLVGVPFQLTRTPEAWCEAFIQYYAYLMQVVDARILEILEALDESGLRESTIVVFTADHGEYGVAHGMMIEKWHGAYEEILRVPAIVSMPGWAFGNDGVDVRGVVAETCHVDLVPTLLGLAGFGSETWSALADAMTGQWPADFVGLDLTANIQAAAADVPVDQRKPPSFADGTARRGVLFITDDMITAPLAFDGDPHSTSSNAAYEVFQQRVELERATLPRLKPGSVVEPCHVRCLRTNEWKLARYCDPSGSVADQWEFYSLSADPLELCNLAVFDQPFPSLISADRYPAGLRVDAAQLQAIAVGLLADLEQAESRMLPPV
jgi:arylsulfatase A-like enzyme